jgi:hypothetical protein
MAFQFQQQRGGQHTRRTSFVHLRDAYHGDTIGSVSVGGIELFHATYGPLLFDAHAVELVADGAVDVRVAMAVDVAPQGGDAVDVVAALIVDQLPALGTHDRERLFLAPSLLLGEGMPEVVVVELRVIHRHLRRRVDP